MRVFSRGGVGAFSLPGLAALGKEVEPGLGCLRYWQVSLGGAEKGTGLEHTLMGSCPPPGLGLWGVHGTGGLTAGHDFRRLLFFRFAAHTPPPFFQPDTAETQRGTKGLYSATAR